MRKFQSKYVVQFVLTASLLVSATACSKKDAEKEDDIPLRRVSVVDVTVGDIADGVEVIGELEGVEEVRIFAQVPERVQRLAVSEGDRVRKGELLALIRGELQTEGVRQAEAALAAAMANRDGVRDNLNRVRPVVKAGAASKSQLEALEAQYRAAEAQVRQARAGLASATAQQERVQITSPIDGMVANVNVREGDMVAGQAPLMTVVQPEKLKAVLRVPERHFLRVRRDNPVVVSPLAARDTEVSGKVTLVSPMVDRMTRTGKVEVHIDNKEGRLMAGSAIRAALELSRRTGALLLPAEAVLLTSETERTGKAYVFVVDGSKAVRREVSVGVRTGDKFEIIEGLAEGEQVVVKGATFLRDGNPIEIVTQEAEARL